MARILPLSFTDDFGNRVKHSRRRTADVIEQLFSIDILIAGKDEWQADDSFCIHAETPEDNIGCAERDEVGRMDGLTFCSLLASREDALLQ